MTDPRLQLAITLARAAERLLAEGLSELSAPMEHLSQQVYEPCVVAVVGTVKAGKSSFINALLREDLAAVGTTETTATINYFSYGTPDPRRPVRCHWRDGRVTFEDHAFLNRLQGHQLEVLQRAAAIDYLEYLLPNRYLEQITLVDTPGTGSVVEEHQKISGEFLALERQLRERHHQDTQRIGSKADAVICLLGAVARARDEDFLKEFHQVTGGQSSALNAIGVLAKIDLQPELVARRHALAEKLAKDLKGSLNTVIPVSAAIRRTLDGFLESGGLRLKQLAQTLQRISPESLDLLLSDEALFLTFDTDDCPISTSQRQAVRGEAPWGTFATLARLLTEGQFSLDERLAQLEEIAGFTRLGEVLERHFLRRAQFLRCYRITHEARQVLNRLRFTELPKYRARDREERALNDRIASALTRIAEGTLSDALKELVQRYGIGQRAGRLEALRETLESQIALIFHTLEADNADFETLRLLEEHRPLFSTEEQEELQPLLGLYGTAPEQRLGSGHRTAEYVAQRQQVWRQLSQQDILVPAHHQVAERAWIRYGLLLKDMTEAPPGEPL